MNVIESLFESTWRDAIAIYVPTPQASIQLQNYLFTLGYHWAEGKQLLYECMNCIYVYKHNFALTYSYVSKPSIRHAIIYNNIIPNLIKLH